MSAMSLSRRSFLATLVAMPVAVWAHGDHGTSMLKVEVSVFSRSETSVGLKFEIINTGSHPVRLEAIWADGATPVRLQRPLEIDPFGFETVRASFVFEKGVPGVFTANLDFGTDGVGPVLVMV